MVSSVELDAPDADAGVDAEIRTCLNPDAPRSFFLYAGAGSGKTYSLVAGLKWFKSTHGAQFKTMGKKIAIITYTNAACDEIVDRLDEDPLFKIATIHSFCWDRIQAFHGDIRSWLLTTLPMEITELEAAEAKGRAGTKASITRQRSIASKQSRLDWLSQPREFIYSPTGENTGRASLSHSEVLKIAASFLVSKPSMQQILINQYPFLLIDESQDTNSTLIDAFFALELARKSEFCLGLVGDMMQRIYGDGKADLGLVIPDHWATPVKRLNRRCPKRIVALANDIRADADGQTQSALRSQDEGCVRLFIAHADTADKAALEESVRQQMAEATGDQGWVSNSGIKTLALEHRMSALRMGFADMLIPLLDNDRFSTGVLNGSLGAVNLFSEAIWPLVEAISRTDDYAVMTLLRSKKSPLLSPAALTDLSQIGDPLAPVREAVAAVVELVSTTADASFADVLQCVAKHRLFPIPKSLEPFTVALDETEIATESDDGDEELETEPESQSRALESLREFLETPFFQINSYIAYIDDSGDFDTHQGVKGREFERVLVVMDDADARGFLFSYEKLFAVKTPTGVIPLRGGGYADVSCC
jgi:DNA helicase-2/ATP-dependent DNA helicase PcrA